MRISIHGRGLAHNKIDNATSINNFGNLFLSLLEELAAHTLLQLPLSEFHVGLFFRRAHIAIVDRANHFYRRKGHLFEKLAKLTSKLRLLDFSFVVDKLLFAWQFRCKCLIHRHGLLVDQTCKQGSWLLVAFLIGMVHVRFLSRHGMPNRVVTARH